MKQTYEEKIEEQKKAIILIGEAITLVENNKMSELAFPKFDKDYWDEGIHLFMDLDLPFDDSFDEVIINISEKDSKILQPKVVAWLKRCLAIATETIINREKEEFFALTMDYKVLSLGIFLETEIPKNENYLLVFNKDKFKTMFSTSSDIVIEFVF